MPRPTAQSRILADFDPDRIEWGHTGVDYNDRLGIDPKHPGFVIKQLFEPPLEWHAYRWQMRLPRRIAASERHLETLTQYGVTVADHFYAPLVPTANAGHETHIFTRRLTGERPDPRNPEHAQRIYKLGSSIVGYLGAVEVGDPFADEYCRLFNYTIGKPWLLRHTATDIYLHDTEPQDINFRASAGQSEVIDAMTFPQLTKEVSTWVETLYDHSPSRRTEVLMMQAEALCREAMQ